MAFALAIFTFGALAAWTLIEPAFYPERHPTHPYEPTHLPFMVTLMGGLCGLGAVFWHRLWSQGRAG